MPARPIPGGVVHRLEHIGDQPANVVVHPLERRAFGPQQRVRDGDDVANSHASGHRRGPHRSGQMATGACAAGNAQGQVADIVSATDIARGGEDDATNLLAPLA